MWKSNLSRIINWANLFLTELLWHHCQKSIDHICHVWPYLYCSIDLCDYLCFNSSVLITIVYYKAWDPVLSPPTLFFFYRIALAILVYTISIWTLEITCAISAKIPDGILIEFHWYNLVWKELPSWWVRSLLIST